MSLWRAYKYGDIDRINALLPELLFFYLGARCPNYAREVFEFLQLLTHECTPVIRDVILQHGLVVNRLGRADSFYPIDQQQEFNNKGIREYGPPAQNASWDQYGKTSHVIPFCLDVIEHVENSITGIRCSHIHKTPNYELDVQVLMRHHGTFKVHDAVPSRKINAADNIKDICKDGILAVKERDVLKVYHEKRDIFTRANSSLQLYEDAHTPSPSPRATTPISDVPSPLNPLTPISARSFTLDLAHNAYDGADFGMAALATRMAELVLED
ncbi:hypothetical protein FRC06_002811 [Ceratobasidium sp. 370]|nr:hypothetical protein FRC06_002811 [Ceratobasidium sp. 370]